MPNRKISQLDDAIALAGDEEVPIVQDGFNVKTTVDDILVIERTRAQGVESAKADLVGGKVPEAQLPDGLARDAEVNDLIEAAVAALPVRVPIFSYGGPVTVSESGRWYPEKDVTIVGMVISLGVAGTTDLVVEMRVNGAAVDTFTLAAGANVLSEVTSALVNGPATDYVTFAVTSAPTGGEHLTIQPSA